MIDPWTYAQNKNEHANQVALFMWANMAANYGFKVANDKDSYIVTNHASYLKALHGVQPEYNMSMLFAIHNQGHGDPIRGAKAKAEGVKSGVPDLMLPVARTMQVEPDSDAICNVLFSYNGLFIELKTPKTKNTAKGKLSVEQILWINKLQYNSYCVYVCYGWIEAANVLMQYLGYKGDKLA